MTGSTTCQGRAPTRGPWSMSGLASACSAPKMSQRRRGGGRRRAEMHREAAAFRRRPWIAGRHPPNPIEVRPPRRSPWHTDPQKPAAFPQSAKVVLKVTPPTGVGGIERYLASGYVRGIGPAMAKRIVALFGESTFEIIEAVGALPPAPPTTCATPPASSAATGSPSGALARRNAVRLGREDGIDAALFLDGLVTLYTANAVQGRQIPADGRRPRRLHPLAHHHRGQRVAGATAFRPKMTSFTWLKTLPQGKPLFKVQPRCCVAIAFKL